MLPADPRLAVLLVNSEEPATGTDALRTLEEMRRWLAGPPNSPPEETPAWLTGTAGAATAADLRGMRRLRTRIRTVFEAASAGDEPAAVAAINGLLHHAPVRPAVTGTAGAWRLALLTDSPSLVTTYLGVAVLGLAQAVADGALARMGVCAALGCRTAFLDRSAGRARRYCSARCASRSHVAAHRARRRESSPA